MVLGLYDSTVPRAVVSTNPTIELEYETFERLAAASPAATA